MNILIFAGGAGTRLWPLSRKNSPKQFAVLDGDRSTLQLAIDRVRPFGLDKVFVSTNERYIPLVREQLPEINPDHIFAEPTRRDLAAAVGLALHRLRVLGEHGPVAVLWADHFMDRPDEFRTALEQAQDIVVKEPGRVVFFAEAPRFANHNLGWMQMGDALENGSHEFLGWKYKPDVASCMMMYESGVWRWNTGYFVFDLDTMLRHYDTHASDISTACARMAADPRLIPEMYPQLPVQSFDSAIIEKLSPGDAVVLPVDLGWSDPGTLYALKESLTESEQAFLARGHVVTDALTDSLVINEQPEKLVAVLGLSGVVVVNTPDALLVCHKDAVPKITDLVKQLEADGKEQYI